MTIGTLIQDRLTEYAGLSALISARAYPLQLPQKPTYEAITYQRISNGTQNGSTVLRESRWQISCWAEQYSEAHELAIQVKGAFEDFTDASIKMAYIVNEIDDYDDVAQAYRTIVDVMLVTTGD